MPLPGLEPPSKVRMWDKDDVRILSVEGSLTISNLTMFQDAWRGETSPALVMDLRQVPYIDSALIGSIVNAYVSRKNAGRTMALVAGDRVHGVLKITKVVSLFPVLETLEDAVTAAKQQPPA